MFASWRLTKDQADEDECCMDLIFSSISDYYYDLLIFVMIKKLLMLLIKIPSVFESQV